MKTVTFILSAFFLITLSSCEKENFNEDETLTLDIKSNKLKSKGHTSKAKRQNSINESNATFISMIETEDGFEITNGVLGNLEVSISAVENQNLAHLTLLDNVSIENTTNKRYFLTVDEGILEVLLEGGHESQQQGILDVVFEGTMSRLRQGILEIVIEGSMDRQGILEALLEGSMDRQGILDVVFEEGMNRYGILEVVLEGGMERH